MEKKKIFISYRQSDTQSEASRLKENLEDVFGFENVFFDIETLEPGLNFATAIEKTIRQSQVVLVLIGPHWMDAKDKEGNLRLFNEDDWVRREVAMALSLHGSGTTVIPVLVKNALPLLRSQLPDNIKSLADFQWAEITIKRWKIDVEKLVGVLKKIIAPPLPPPPPPPPPLPKPLPINIFQPQSIVIDSNSIKAYWSKYKYYIISFCIVAILVENCASEESYVDPYGYNSKESPLLSTQISNRNQYTVFIKTYGVVIKSQFNLNQISDI